MHSPYVDHLYESDSTLEMILICFPSSLYFLQNIQIYVYICIEDYLLKFKVIFLQIRCKATWTLDNIAAIIMIFIKMFGIAKK